jgi:hypothetical protein
MADQTLSPIAQAVCNAYFDAPCNNVLSVIAVLRAIAEEVILPKYGFADWEMAHVIYQEIDSIADELEGFNA